MWWSESPPRRALLLGGLALLGGCGFQLRRAPQMGFGRIALTGFAPRSGLAEELRRSLAATAEVVADPNRAEVVLQALSDARERSVVATTTAAQVREIQLRLRLNFRVHTPGGRELIAPSELLLKRDLSYSESAALAKEQEEAQLFREMQTDIAAQVLRRLAALPPL